MDQAAELLKVREELLFAKETEQSILDQTRTERSKFEDSIR